MQDSDLNQLLDQARNLQGENLQTLLTQLPDHERHAIQTHLNENHRDDSPPTASRSRRQAPMRCGDEGSLSALVVMALGISGYFSLTVKAKKAAEGSKAAIAK